MKKIVQGVAMLMALLSVSGCSKIVYTHEQVMQSYHTKNDVVKQFGYPDQKREANGVTEWVYDCDTISTFSTSKTKVVINGSYNGVADSLKTANVSEFTSYATYIRFTFDEEGRVLKYDSHGVSFAKKKSNPLGTVLIVAGSVTAVILLIGATINLDGFNVWY